MPDLIIGTAVPRSGTTSLSVLLNSCRGASVRHEDSQMPFGAGLVHLWREAERIPRELGGPRYVGDVSFMWLPHLHHLRSETDAKIIGLTRERERCIESCMATQDDAVFGERQYMWPAIDLERVGRREAWERYYDFAMEQFEMFDVPTFRTSNLSGKETQKEIFDAAGIAEEDRQYHPDLRYNARPDT